MSKDTSSENKSGHLNPATIYQLTLIRSYANVSGNKEIEQMVQEIIDTDGYTKDTGLIEVHRQRPYHKP